MKKLLLLAILLLYIWTTSAIFYNYEDLRTATTRDNTSYLWIIMVIQWNTGTTLYQIRSWAVSNATCPAYTIWDFDNNIIVKTWTLTSLTGIANTTVNLYMEAWKKYRIRPTNNDSSTSCYYALGASASARPTTTGFFVYYNLSTNVYPYNRNIWFNTFVFSWADNTRLPTTITYDKIKKYITWEDVIYLWWINSVLSSSWIDLIFTYTQNFFRSLFRSH